MPGFVILPAGARLRSAPSALSGSRVPLQHGV